MGIISDEQAQEAERLNEERIRKQKVNSLMIDRWSVFFILFILSIVLFFVILKKGSLKYGLIPLATPLVVYGLIVGKGSGRIRKNEYEGLMYYKGENDCGLSSEPLKDIDGIIIKKQVAPGQYQERIFKAPDGTDIKIDKDGNVSFIGFGSKIISKMRGGGYLPEAPDECWK